MKRSCCCNRTPSVHFSGFASCPKAKQKQKQSSRAFGRRDPKGFKMKRSLLGGDKGTKKRAVLVPNPDDHQRPAETENGTENGRLTLSPDQQRAATMVRNRLSVFLSGEAGSGKSFLLQHLVAWLRGHGKTVAVTASTGVAASHFKGAKTLHSLLGLKKESKDEVAFLLRTCFGELPHWNQELYDRYFESDRVKAQTQPPKAKAKPNPNTADEFLQLIGFHEQEQGDEDEDALDRDPPVKPSPEAELEKHKKQRSAVFRVLERFKESFDIDVLVVDEISMVSDTVLNVLDYTARMVRGAMDWLRPVSERQNLDLFSYGGIQVIFTGDFYQLPPVNASYAFSSPAWHEGIHPVFLTTQHRQHQTDELYEVVSALRDNVFAKTDLESKRRRDRVYQLLQNRVGAKLEESQSVLDISVPTLVSRNDEAKRINEQKQQELEERQRLNGFPVVVLTETQVSENEKRYARGSPFDVKHEQFLRLTINTLVMCTCNMKVGTVSIHNGMVGRVVGFQCRPPDTSPVVYLDAEPPAIVKKALDEWARKNPVDPIVEFENGIECVVPGNLDEVRVKRNGKYVTIAVSVVPSLTACWAITIHKSQGATLSRAKIKLERTFTQSQIYVALSRVSSLEGVSILGLLPSVANTSWQINPRVVHWVANQKALEQTEQQAFNWDS